MDIEKARSRSNSSTDDPTAGNSNSVGLASTALLKRTLQADDKPASKRFQLMIEAPERPLTNECEMDESKSNTAEDVEGEPNYFDCLPEDLLVNIFSYMNSHQICVSVSRVCTRWHRLTKDQDIWKDVVLKMNRKATLKHITKPIRAYCNRSTLSFTVSRPYTLNMGKGAKKNKAISTALVKCIAKRCPNLKSFAVERDQVGGVDIYKNLPKSVQKISLKYCHIAYENMVDFSASTSDKFCLPNLTHLDFSGATYCLDKSRSRLYLFGDRVKFPDTVTSLSFRDADMKRLFNDVSLPNVLSTMTQLKHLDIGGMELKTDTLKSLSTDLINLTSVVIAGSLIKESNLFDDVSIAEEEDVSIDVWRDIWTTGFPSLLRLNAINATFNSGEYCYPLKNVVSAAVIHLLDADGGCHGDWTYEEKMAGNCGKELFDYHTRVEEEHRQEIKRMRRQWRYRHFGNFYDSEDGDDGYDDDEYMPLNRRCSVM